MCVCMYVCLCKGVEKEEWLATDELRARDERIPSYGMRAQRFKGLPACPLFKCMLNARGDARDSLINPLTSHPSWEPHRAAACVCFTVARRNTATAAYLKHRYCGCGTTPPNPCSPGNPREFYLCSTRGGRTGTSVERFLKTPEDFF